MTKPSLPNLEARLDAAYKKLTTLERVVCELEERMRVLKDRGLDTNELGIRLRALENLVINTREVKRT